MRICNSKSTTELYGWKIHSPSPWFLLIHQFFATLYDLCYAYLDWSPFLFFLSFRFSTSYLFPLSNILSSLLSAIHVPSVFLHLPSSRAGISSAPVFCSWSLTQSYLSHICRAAWRCFCGFHPSSVISEHRGREHFQTLKWPVIEKACLL